MMSGRLVAPIMKTVFLLFMPSISGITRGLNGGADPTGRRPRHKPAAYARSVLAMWTIRSSVLQEYPHSLSYQATTLTKRSFRGMPALASKIEVQLSPMKSEPMVMLLMPHPPRILPKR